MNNCKKCGARLTSTAEFDTCIGCQSNVTYIDLESDKNSNKMFHINGMSEESFEIKNKDFEKDLETLRIVRLKYLSGGMKTAIRIVESNYKKMFQEKTPNFNPTDNDCCFYAYGKAESPNYYKYCPNCGKPLAKNPR